jgi:hypothetical protein
VRAKAAVEQCQLVRPFKGERVRDAERVEQKLPHRLHACGDVGCKEASRERRRHSDEDEEDDGTPQAASQRSGGAGAYISAKRNMAHIDRTNPRRGGCARSPLVEP